MKNSMHSFIHYSKASGLSMSQIGALFRVHHKGDCDVSGVGEELGISPAAASQLLERLVQQGLILRSENPNDRRMKQIVLTENGRRVLQESIAARQSWFVTLADALSESERAQVMAAMAILIEKANQLALSPS